MSGYSAHRQAVDDRGPRKFRCGVITISDSRTPETDLSGKAIIDRLSGAGHEITHYSVVSDDAERISGLVRDLCEQRVTVLITNGGTGIARRDSTFEAIDALLEKRLPGFGELFRMLSFEQIGPAAMLSRATAGLRSHTLIFALPGSPNAVGLAMDRLILPELDHIVWETVRQ